MSWREEKERIKIVPLEDSYIPALWNIMQDYPKDLPVRTFSEFEIYLKTKAIDVMVGIETKWFKEIVGFGYLESLHEGLGCVALFVNKKAINPISAVRTLKKLLPYYFQKHNLKMAYSVTRKENNVCVRLMKLLGFKDFRTLKDYNENGDYVFAGILFETA